MIVVGYVRLSRDEDKENYSSIESQIDIINEYAQKNNWKINKYYIDDNFSGYTFNRPQFNQLIEDINNDKKNIQIVISKDLSRIGRHNAKTLLFIEEIQAAGKRLLLPEEGRGYDSNNDDDEILGIRTWYNERYVKDISKKIKSNMHSKQKKGQLAMGNHYGYLKNQKDKSILSIDENIRPIIEEIFKLYINGLGYKRICDILNEKGYPTPSYYLKERHAIEKDRVFRNKVSGKWQTHNIQRIIQDPIYMGTLVTHKRENKRVKGKQEVVPKEEQFIFENHHEGIISKEDFVLAQNIKSKRSSKKIQSGIGHALYKNNSKYDYVFSSFIKCGDCGFASTGINLLRLPKVKKGYECTQYAKYGLQRCSSHRIEEDELIFDFQIFLKQIKEKYIDFLSSFSLKDEQKNTDKLLNRYEKELNILNEEIKILLNQKIKDLIKETNEEIKTIIEDNYNQLQKDKQEKIIYLKNQIEKLKKSNYKETKLEIETAINILDSIINSERPDRKNLEQILEKIVIFKDRTCEFHLNHNIDKLTSTI